MRPWFVTVILAIASTAAAALCLFALVTTGRVEFALTGAVLLLALAQIASYLARDDSPARQRDRIDLVRAVSELGADVEALKRRLADMEERFGDADALNDAASRMQEEVRSLQQTVARFARTAQARPGRGKRGAPAPVLDEPPPQLRPEDHDLMLEPIVRLDGGETVSYRAALDIDGWERLDDPQAELAVMRQAMPVIRRLRDKGRGTAVICRASGPALADPGFVRRLTDLFGREPDSLASLVLDIDQSTLAALNPEGLEGLAWIGEHGAQFCLSGADTASPDVPALARLRFSYIDLDARRIAEAALLHDLGDRYAATQLFRSAARHGVAVIASGVADDPTLDAAAPYVTLARGPLFSPPRRVRAEAIREDRAAVVA
jgi:EAL domain-containing protein (putative c-di-GMP-specific phosphodiesterase class I)